MRTLLLFTALALAAICPAWHAPAALAQEEDGAARQSVEEAETGAQDAQALGGEPGAQALGDDPGAPTPAGDSDAQMAEDDAEAQAQVAASDDEAQESEGPAPIYRWTDTEGAVHYTKDPLQTPALLQGLLDAAPPGPEREPGLSSDFVASAGGDAADADADAADAADAGTTEDDAADRPGGASQGADDAAEAGPDERAEAEGAPDAGRETPEEP